MPFQQTLDLVAEVALHLKDQGAGAARRVGGVVRKDLFGERIHAATGLAGPDGAEDGNASEETALGDRQPSRMFRRTEVRLMVDFTDDCEQMIPAAASGIWRKRISYEPSLGLDGEDIQQCEAR